MTTREDARRAAARLRPDGLRLDAGRDFAQRDEIDRGDEDDTRRGGSPALTLPERLYAARERKGVDLYRAERDTKIRARYLAALERGEYAELPGDVYTKGFLRNYALYLNLDPEEIVGQWRRERGHTPTPKTVLTVPRPIAQPRPGLQFSPSVIVAALLTVLIVGIGAWLGIQVMRFAKPPTLAVTAPREATLQLAEDQTSYTLAGTSIPNATITVELAGGSRQASADSTGKWTLPVDVRRGKNEFKIDATDPETGKHAESPVMIVITVPFREIEAPALTVNQPADGTTFENGAIPVQGTATNATQVAITAAYEGPVPGGPAASPGTGPKPSGPPPPPAITVTVADDGSWNTGNTPLQLTTGRWSLTVTASNAQGKSASQTRHVAVAYKGVNLVVAIKGGPAWIKVWVDGQLDPTVGRAGKTLRDGQVLTFSGQTSIEVRTGSSGATTFTVNGQSLGALGRRGVPETWLFKPPAAPALTQHQ
ncbi:MAG TPA: RodZ domain-containing protein [Candidatus Limnocylindrales bacterium]|nr:RodZ domain-containing protein [Candidatus Limnocylindrales bacterium]